MEDVTTVSDQRSEVVADVIDTIEQEQGPEPVTEYLSYHSRRSSSSSSTSMVSARSVNISNANIVSISGKQSEVDDRVSRPIETVAGFDQLHDIKIVMIKSPDSSFESIVLTALESIETRLAGYEFDEQTVPTLPVPIYVPHDTLGRWRQTNEMLMQTLRSHGVYLFVVWWWLRSDFQLESTGTRWPVSLVPVLHCACKDETLPFGGRLGPINVFVPRKLSTGAEGCVNGVYVQLWLEEEGEQRTLAMSMNDVDIFQIFRAERRAQLQTLHKDNNQLWVLVARGGVCVGMQVLNTRREEVTLRAQHVDYHHERPLILPGGHYLIEGVFEANFLNFDNNRQLNFDERCFADVTSPKIVVLSEGAHLLRITSVVINEDQLVVETTMPTRKRRKARRKNKMNRLRSRWMMQGAKTSRTNNNATRTRLSALSMSIKGGHEASSTDEESITSDIDQEEEEEDETQRSKTYLVEVCLDCAYHDLILLDFNQLRRDWQF